MQYVVLLRGINVGGNKKVDMKKLVDVLVDMGYQEVTNYIDSGNILLTSSKKKETIQQEVIDVIYKHFEVDCTCIIKTKQEIVKIVSNIPSDRENDTTQKTDVAFLFPEADRKDIIDTLPWDKEYLRIMYKHGAICWNVARENYNKSKLSKIASHKMYQYMTVRNINTMRVLADMKKAT